MSMPSDPDTDPLWHTAHAPERKVTAATSTVGGVLGVVVTVLTILQGTAGVLDHAPAWAVALIGAAVAVATTVATYWNAYAAPHTARPDLPERQR